MKNKEIRYFFKEQSFATLQVKESGTPFNVSLSLAQEQRHFRTPKLNSFLVDKQLNNIYY